MGPGHEDAARGDQDDRGLKLQDLLCEQVAGGLKGIQLLWTGLSTEEKQQVVAKLESAAVMLQKILGHQGMLESTEGQMPHRCMLAVGEATGKLESTEAVDSSSVVRDATALDAKAGWRVQRGTKKGIKGQCFSCGESGHYIRECK